MIDDKTKDMFLKFLEKYGNVSLACNKAGINRCTYYRWKETDKQFKKRTSHLIKLGRENMTDMSEHALLVEIRNGNIRAIEFSLRHNSSRYKRQSISTTIIHKRDMPTEPAGPRTLEDLIVESAQDNRDLAEKFIQMGGIPPRADGSPIESNEISKYKVYIEEWYKKKELDEKAEKESESNNQTNEDPDSKLTST